jgi:two-component system chemotaxis response regulator CheY
MTLPILIVDDSTSVRKMVESALRFKKYTVVSVTDGLEALDALEKNQFSLLILDVNMPRLDGLSLLKAIREQPRWAKTPILMLTT